MKKKILYISLIVFLFMIALNVPSFATFYISDFEINADINSSGDMKVKETITYYTNETVNGLTRKILTKNQFNQNNSASSMELIGVYVEGEPCDRVTYASTGDSMVYEYTTNGSYEYNIKLYTPFVTEVKTIEYDYILKDVAVRYNDIAELYWNFIGNQWDCNIQNLIINITLPELASRGTSYVYAHGSDNGIFTKYGNRITLMANYLSQYQALDARILFEREAISDSTKIVNKNVLEKYINDEEGFYKNQEEKKVFGNFSIRTLAEGLTIIILVAWFASYIFYDKEYSVEKVKYFREIPYDLEPEMIQYLYYGKVTSSSYYIGFLNLVKHGVFKLQERVNKVGKKVQTIIYNKDEKVKLSEPEQNIKNTIKGFLLKDETTGEESIDMLTLAKKMENSSGFGFRTYKKNLESEKESLFDKPAKAPKKILWLAILAIIAIIGIITVSATIVSDEYMEEILMLPLFLGFITLIYLPMFATVGSQLFALLFLIFHCGAFQFACFMIMHESNVGWLYIPYLLCFIFIQYLIRIRKYSREEREAIAKIKGLRRYIKDYSMLRSKDGIVENIALWEDYFIIAIALGLNKKTINYFYHYGKEQVSSNLGMSMHYTHTYTDFHYPVYHSFYSYQRGYTTYSSSSSGGSSYSGSSGGFSGGSSSGGGGGRRWRRRTLLKNEYKYKICKKYLYET